MCTTTRTGTKGSSAGCHFNSAHIYVFTAVTYRHYRGPVHHPLVRTSTTGGSACRLCLFLLFPFDFIRFYSVLPCHGFAGEGRKGLGKGGLLISQRGIVCTAPRPQAAPPYSHIPVLYWSRIVPVCDSHKYVSIGTMIVATGTIPYTSNTGCCTNLCQVISQGQPAL